MCRTLTHLAAVLRATGLALLSGEGTTEQVIEKISRVGILLVNIAALVVANYQCYKARNVPNDFNESFYIALANAAMLEAVLLGGPILLVVSEDPVANFLVRSILATIVCFTILLPVFVPKYVQSIIRNRRRTAGQRVRVSLGHVPARRESFNLGQGNLPGDIASSQKTLKKGQSIIVRNDDYYFQRLTNTLESEVRGSRARVSYGNSYRK